jgi:hypothetical protein
MPLHDISCTGLSISDFSTGQISQGAAYPFVDYRSNGLHKEKNVFPNAMLRGGTKLYYPACTTMQGHCWYTPKTCVLVRQFSVCQEQSDLWVSKPFSLSKLNVVAVRLDKQM